jgi:hypothetical protein
MGTSVSPCLLVVQRHLLPADHHRDELGVRIRELRGRQQPRRAGSAEAEKSTFKWMYFIGSTNSTACI